MDEVVAAEDVNVFSLYPAFVHNEKRIFDKACLCMKIVGFAFYTTSTHACINKKSNVEWWFVSIIIVMFISICNTIRYEYAFHKKNGTIFSSGIEFKQWKMQQRPQIKYGLDLVEFIIKIGFFGKTFPPTFDIYDDATKEFSMCPLGITVLTMHTLGMFVGWTLCMMFLFCMCMHIHIDPPIALNSLNSIVIDTETECCICLDKNNKPWATVRCMHSFHATCIAEWMKQKPSCPICRSSLVV